MYVQKKSIIYSGKILFTSEPCFFLPTVMYSFIDSEYEVSDSQILIEMLKLPNYFPFDKSS